ncbi:MAG: beta-galactosidase trimerization domain-containing protein [Planctomycetota bacterium]
MEKAKNEKSQKTAVSDHIGSNLDDEIVVLMSYHEPVAFTIRGGRAHKDLENDSFHYSEQLAKKLADLGVNIAVWHCYKGLGIKTEAAETQKTAQFFKHLKKYGISCGVYINQGSIFADTFIAENPQAKDWIAVDQFGLPHQYSEYYRNYYRWRPCSSNPEFAEYIGTAGAKAVKETGADHIHFDNAAQMPCYCEKCKKLFPEYCLEKYPSKSTDDRVSFKQRFGHDYNGTFQIPRGTARQPIDNIPAAYEPGLYEWVRYRQKLYENTLRTSCEMIRAASKDVRICWNLALDYGEFTGMVWGLDPESTYRCHTEYFFSEDSNFPGLEEGRLISHIRTYKYGRAMDSRAMTYHHSNGSDQHELLSYAESVAFNNGCIGYIGYISDNFNPNDKKWDMIKKALKLFREYKDIYIHAKCCSEIALYRCSESETANWADTTVAKHAVEQVLIKNSIQYDQIINDKFDDINNYRLLICPNTITVSDTIIQKIADFVKQGGKVLCTELSFTCDQINRKRLLISDEGLAGERDSTLGRTSGKADVSRILACLGLDAKYADNIFYLPRIYYTKTFTWDPRSSQLPIIGKEYFAEPLNKDEVLRLIRTAFGQFNIEITAPENVIAGYVKTADGRRVIHVFDYEPGRNLIGIQLRFKIDTPGSSHADFITFDSQEKVEIKYNGGYACCTLPIFKTYGFLVI